MTEDGFVFCFPSNDLKSATYSSDSNYTNYIVKVPVVTPCKECFLSTSHKFVSFGWLYCSSGRLYSSKKKIPSFHLIIVAVSNSFSRYNLLIQNSKSENVSYFLTFLNLAKNVNSPSDVIKRIGVNLFRSYLTIFIWYTFSHIFLPKKS